MNRISKTLPFTSHNNQVARATSAFMEEIHAAYLGRDLSLSDVERFTYRLNPNYVAVVDLFCDGRKFGSLKTTFVLDHPRSITLEFSPLNSLTDT